MEVIICLPKNSSEMLEDTIQDYRNSSPNCLIHEGLPNVTKMGLTENNDHKIIGKLYLLMSMQSKFCSFVKRSLEHFIGP